MKKISKTTRDEAILICAVSASNPDLTENYWDAKNALGASIEALDLALAAWQLVVDERYNRQLKVDSVDAEAEYLLRDGWSPS